MTDTRLHRTALVLVGLAALLASASCTFEPGTGFGEIESATLNVRFVPGDARALGDGRFLSNLGYAIELSEFALHVDALELLSLSASEADGFDPANPPEGYTLCHNGHCHHESGDLVDYEDIQAELLGQTPSYDAVASWEIDANADFLEVDTHDVTASPESDFSPSSTLGKTTISQVRLSTSRLRLQGTIDAHSGDYRGPSIPWSVDVEIDVALVAIVSRPVDRGEPARISIDARFLADPRWFDDVDFAELATAGDITWTDNAADFFVDRLSEQSFSVDLE